MLAVKRLAGRGAFYVQTQATYSALAERGREARMPEASHRRQADPLVVDGNP